MAKKNAVKPQTLVVDVVGARASLHEIGLEAKKALQTGGRRPLSRILILVETGLRALRGEPVSTEKREDAGA